MRRVRLTCPHCLGHDLTPVRSIGNGLRLGINVSLYCLVRLLEVLLAFFWLLLVISHPLHAILNAPERPRIEAVPRLDVWRRCKGCGATMLDGAEPTPVPTCGGCGYNLSGNASGKCPECGWIVPGLTRAILHYEGKLQLNPRGSRTTNDVNSQLRHR